MRNAWKVTERQDEQNAEEKYYTMILMKRAKLAQELTELDAVVSNVLGYLASAYKVLYQDLFDRW